MIEIALNGGVHVALVDERDAAFLSQWKWKVQITGRLRYARRDYRADGRYVTIYMHREIMRPAPGLVIDHISGDGLDNRRDNLRVVRQMENCWNRTAARNGAGVTFHPKKQKWRARIDRGGRRYELGFFSSEQEAVDVRQFVEGRLWRLPGCDETPAQFDLLRLPPTVRKAVMEATRV